jgi:cold shock CspA family protein/transcription elongation factor Elf1
MKKGRIEKIFPQKDFAFVRLHDGRSAFLHKSSTARSLFRELVVGKELAVSVEGTAKGLRVTQAIAWVDYKARMTKERADRLYKKAEALYWGARASPVIRGVEMEIRRIERERPSEPRKFYACPRCGQEAACVNTSMRTTRYFHSCGWEYYIHSEERYVTAYYSSPDERNDGFFDSKETVVNETGQPPKLLVDGGPEATAAFERAIAEWRSALAKAEAERDLVVPPVPKRPSFLILEGDRRLWAQWFWGVRKAIAAYKKIV